MKLYRVCTENKNYSDILDYLDKHFPDGYTVIHANGAWQGKREKSLVIEIVGEEVPPLAGQNADIGKLIWWLKKCDQQQTVMLQVISITMDLL